MKYKPAVYCGHPKECPRGTCDCSPDCACRERMCRCRNVYVGKRCERQLGHTGYCRTDVGRWFEVDAAGPRGVLPPPPVTETKGNPMPAETDYLTSLARELAPEAGFGPAFAPHLSIKWSPSGAPTALAIELTSDGPETVPLGKGLPFAAPEVVRERLLEALRSLHAKVFSAGSKAASAPKAPPGEAVVAMLPPGYLRVLAAAEQTTEARRLFQAYAVARDISDDFDALDANKREGWLAAARASFAGRHDAYEQGLAQGMADAAKGGAK